MHCGCFRKEHRLPVSDVSEKKVVDPQEGKKVPQREDIRLSEEILEGDEYA